MHRTTLNSIGATSLRAILVLGLLLPACSAPRVQRHDLGFEALEARASQSMGAETSSVSGDPNNATEELRFDGEVALVTGAAHGLGPFL